MLEPRNPQITAGTRLLQNLQAIQLQNEIFTDETLYSGQFGIEMETGTGKTYVYIRTILRLYETYGFKKFMIVVPSVAIRKGVEKTLSQLQKHLKALHNIDISKHSFVYDSKNLGRLLTFVEIHELDICVINSQAFASDITRIRSEREQGGEILWERIKDIHPIIIIDEPQKVEGVRRKPSRSREQLSELRPLFELKYSATHRQEFPINMVYSLDSYQAYEQQLVKRIRVKTVYGQIPKDQPYIRYIKFNTDLSAAVEIFHQAQGGRIKPTKFSVLGNTDLHELSGNLPQYAGFRIAANPHKERPLAITTPKGGLELALGTSNCEFSQEAAIRIQIRLAIQNHFEKQFELLDAGLDIKAITLFFVDAVDKVRDTQAADGRGEYLRIFDEEYAAILASPTLREKLKQYHYLLSADTPVEQVREGYFARDKSNAIAEVETKTTKGELVPVKKSQEDIDRGIELILEKKDELISFKEPLAFIFSHSALREGWDNPNVFTLCTLRHTNSEIAKKQEIGRGLRLPVDIHGNRITNETVNELTVIANDHYDHFAEALQKDFNEEAGFNRDEVTETLLQNTLVLAGVPTHKITPALVDTLKNELLRKKIIKADHTLIKGADLDAVVFADDTLNEHAIQIKTQFRELMVKKGARKLPLKNGDEEPIINSECKYVSESEFKSILDQLAQHLVVRTLYKFNLDADDFIRHCIVQINELFKNQILQQSVIIEGGRVKYNPSGEIVAEQEGAARTVAVEVLEPAVKKTDLQIIDHIMYHTFLPRLAIIEIVRGIEKRILLNSQDRLEEVTRLIANELMTAKAEGVHSYEVIKGYQLNRSKIFEADIIDEEALKAIKRVYQTKTAKRKGLHHYYNMDSKGEYDFAEALDDDPDVFLFTKLKKGGFVIDTPYGHYSPDWAIVYRKDEHLKLFFIVETKIDKDWPDLDSKEQSKIKCGGLHFAAVSSEIQFHWVKNYEDFRGKVQKAETYE